MAHTPDPTTPSEAKRWTLALAWAGILTAGGAGYVSIAFGNLDTLQGWSFLSAAVASFLYATAFASGSVSYYTGWPNMRHGYQKQIGILGFWFSLFYSLTLLVLYPDFYYYGFLENFWTWDITLGLAAMAIFTAMTVINAKPVAPYFSWNTIKFVLGLGFVAYALLVIRAVMVEGDIWMYWLSTFDGYPPGRLVLSVLALAVLLLRISVPIHAKLTGRSKPKK